MRGKIVIILAILAIFILALAGCERVPGTNMLKIKPPVNDDLSIAGEWKVETYKVLENNMYPKDDINKLINKKIYISDSMVNIDSQIFKNVNYKLKVVEGNYCISYQSKYNVSNLGVNNVNVITAADKNNVIFDFFSIDSTEGYVYYRGILLKVKKIGDIKDQDFIASDGEANINSLSVNEDSSETGVLMGLKVPIKTDSGKIGYKYMTLWINYKDNKVSIHEAPYILFPRMTGMWTVFPRYTYENGFYKQFFDVNPLNGKQKDNVPKTLDGNYNLYQSINYIGNDYIGLETYKGNDFKGEYPYYKMVPIDIFSSNKGVALEDIYNNQINPVFSAAFQSELNNLNPNQKKLVDNNVNYKNFTLLRQQGKWIIQGKISPVNDNYPSYNFDTNIKPNANLVKYDTLYVPWRLLRADMPTIEDAYTSPNGKLAIILIKGELLVYKINNNNKLEGSPIFRYDLNEGAKVIMAEWCSGDYVTYWNTSFEEYKKKVEEE
ncbi:hypothetical protein [Clostridium thermobutyricum]|uniref:hypothetical protein n=1 Tax=Clostridium thermobutyricum TaxID=29372 RepID=UPI0018A8D150|nr:hypothetical protein [Clostridium thermobutyricum]